MIDKRLTWYRWERPDPISKDRWTAFTVSVYAPTYERPYVSILTSIANGGGKVLFRSLSFVEANTTVPIPQEGHERLRLAIIKAESILFEIKRDLRLIADARTLQPGAQLVRTDTGEIIAEAEQILRDANDYES